MIFDGEKTAIETACEQHRQRAAENIAFMDALERLQHSIAGRNRGDSPFGLRDAIDLVSNAAMHEVLLWREAWLLVLTENARRALYAKTHPDEKQPGKAP